MLIVAVLIKVLFSNKINVKNIFNCNKISKFSFIILLFSSTISIFCIQLIGFPVEKSTYNIYGLISAIILAPLVEEFIYRYLFFSVIDYSKKVVLNAFCFSIIHILQYDIVTVVVIFFLSLLFLSITYYLTRSFLIVLASHFSWNLAFYLRKTDLVSDIIASTWSSFLIPLTITTMIIFVIMLIKEYKKNYIYPKVDNINYTFSLFDFELSEIQYCII